MSSTDESFDQSALITALLRPDCYPYPATAVEHMQTHISHLLLAGDYAYKIKKPVNLGFLDFTSLEHRQYYCQQELRLNKRLAPDLYLDCLTIGGDVTHPVFGLEPAIEYAVRMHRFPQDARLDRVLVSGRLETRHFERLARQLACFHSAISIAGPAAPFGEPEQVRQPMLDDFTYTRPQLSDPADLAILAEVERWTLDASERLRSLLTERKAGGWIRECHGDLHLGNMILTGEGQVTIFDCIEFNDALRWIDVINDLAFLTMDLQARGVGHFAQRVLNTWLEFSGDFAGVALLTYYQVYRAMVRAKIHAIQASQEGIPEADRTAACGYCRNYLRLARALTQEPAPFLLVTHGVSGSGKSHRTGQLMDALPGAIRIRADVERKRLFGLGPLDDSRSSLGQGLYTAEASARTYQRLLDLADGLLASGRPVLVDATFLKRAHREPFRRLAATHSVPFILLECNAGPATLRRRVTVRRARGDDAAEADVAVLEQQLQSVEPPAPDENPLKTNGDEDLERLRAAILAARQVS
ncbi:MAG TPA: AAA family ATPase [Candidatus Competibacteraceae bacterium]|nr:AAA family ATPase [Candidatus Competibacteraceae bacterium]MCP5132691.1 AAA family ATPase [Gammaproteobacteria bacterium]HPF58619.1 AAA family ATPase [Candidatus Competibacteraceae bacterium]